jgi:diguanylate cyclase (GGDEF)-like protein/PAS domain S-box-containing protein
MSSFSPHELELALRECAAEPIHQIGKIQPNGVLLVLSKDSPHTVLQASDNLANFLCLPVSDVIGKSLASLLGEPATLQIEQLIQKLGNKDTTTGKVNIIHKQSSLDLQAHLYASEGLLVLELAQDEDTYAEHDLAHMLLDIQQTLLASENSDETSAYLDQIVKLVRGVTGYDSVMAYRFDSNWDGEVIGQSRVEDAPSYLGLRFPASDIPPQARRLYTQNLVRIVADVDAIPIPISPVLNPVSQQPLDMTYSALRSLSPIHMQYLRNMGVQASMVISLIQNGHLWGLIACHHRTAKPISIAMREAAIFISRMASAKLTLIESQDQLNQVEQTHAILSDLVNHITLDNIEAVLQRLLPRLQSLLDADGVIIVADGSRHIGGDVPASSDMDDLLAWLGTQLQTSVFSCDDLEQQFAPAHTYRAMVSGLLVASLTNDISNCIMWLRKEKPQQVQWAGIAEKGLVQDAAGNLQLTPRNSFEIWTETCRGRSSAWSTNEIRIAQMLTVALPKSLVLKHQLEQQQALRKFSEVTATTIWRQMEAMTAAVPGVVYQFLLTPSGEWKFTYVSKGIQDLYEVTAEQALRDHNALTSRIFLEDRDSHRESVERAALALSVWEHEHRISTPSGQVKWVHGLATPQRQADGGILWSGLLTDVSERKKNEAALQESELRFRSLANAAPVLIWVAEPDKSCSWFNSSWLEYTGRSLEQEFGNGWAEGVHPDDLSLCLDIYTSCFEARQSFQMEYRLRGKDNQFHWFIDVGKPRMDAQGQFMGYIGMLTDINERKKIEEMIRFRQFSLDHAGEEVFWIDKDAHILDVNKLSCSKLGYSHEELCSLTVADVDPSFSMDKWPDHWQELKQSGSQRFQSFHKSRDGKVFPVEVVANYFEYDGEEYNCALVRDISDHVRLLQELDHQAKTDFLTELANRRYFLELAEQELARCQRYGNSLSILMLDIDFFKTINDTYGHKAGDQVLQKLASVCKEILREVDVIGRIGGEEFAIFLPETPGQQAIEVAERICQALGSTKVPLENPIIELQFTVSIGVTTMITTQETVDNLLQKADAALYQAKNTGRNQVVANCY